MSACSLTHIHPQSMEETFVVNIWRRPCWRPAFNALVNNISKKKKKGGWGGENEIQ